MVIYYRKHKPKYSWTQFNHQKVLQCGSCLRRHLQRSLSLPSSVQLPVSFGTFPGTLQVQPTQNLQSASIEPCPGLYRWLPLGRGLDGIFVFFVLSISRCTVNSLCDGAQLIQFYFVGLWPVPLGGSSISWKKKLTNNPQRLNTMSFLNIEKATKMEKRTASQDKTLDVVFQKEMRVTVRNTN